MKNERRIPVIGRHPAITVGLMQRLAARHAAAKSRLEWIKRVKLYLSSI